MQKNVIYYYIGLIDNIGESDVKPKARLLWRLS